jgi:membrane-associated phospholipid phosphatase
VNQHLSSAGGLKAGGVIGNGITQVGGALTVYVIGRVRHQRRVAHTGMDLLRAQLVTGALTESIKVAVGRERPDGKPYSFPSGHASLSVATATVIYRHFGAWWSLPAYGAAAYVGASRLRENRHWLSDVVFGSAVGAIGGRTVTRHGRSNFAWAPVYLPHGGLAVLVSRTTAPRAVSAAPHERQEHRVAACAGSGSSDLVERPLR